MKYFAICLVAFAAFFSSLSAQQPGLSYERWLGLDGSSIALSQLTGSPAFLAAPDYTDVLTTTESPTNVADKFGSRIRGTVTAPYTGNYTFWVAGARSCELWLSTDDRQFNRRKLAFVNNWSDPRAWDAQANQKSEPVHLVAGQKYFIEILQFDPTGGDWVSVAWSYETAGLKNWSLEAGAVATQSSTDYGGLASRAIDGNRNRWWSGGSVCHTANTEGSWWQVDLGADRPISRVDIWNRQDAGANRLSNFRLSVLDAAGQEVYGEDFYAEGGYGAAVFQWCLPKTVTGRTVKIQLLGANARGDHILNFAEFEVWGDSTVPGNAVAESPSREFSQPGLAAAGGQTALPEDATVERNTVVFPRGLIATQLLETFVADADDPDGDGLPSAWESQYGFDPNDANDGSGGAFGDPDGDAVPNWQEYQLGSDPHKRTPKPGHVRRDYWVNQYFYSTSVLVRQQRYYQSADVSDYIRPAAGELTGPSSAQYFAQRLRGFIQPDEDGEYTFWLSSWTSAELWISTDETPWKKERVVVISPEKGNNHGVRHGTANPWDVYVNQMSAKINLQAGKKYYFEIIHQQGHSGPAHVTVAWAHGDGAREVIPRENLWAYTLREDDLSDDDCLPDAWESQHGLNPQDNGVVDMLREGERGDFDQDGLNNRLEYVLGTDPSNADSDGDGVRDGDEYHSYGTDPAVNDAPADSLVQDIDLASYSSSTAWNSTSSGLVSGSFRGDITWNFSVPGSGFWLMQVETILHGNLNLSEEMQLELLVDGKSVGRQRIRYGTNRRALLRQLTPHLSAGAHTLTLRIHNMLARRQIGVKSVQILQPGGVDLNNDGIPDWITSQLQGQNHLYDYQAVSRVSPAFVEGVASQRPLTTLNGVAVTAGTGTRHWFHNLPLDEQSLTPFSVSYDGGLVEQGGISWQTTNVNEGGSILLRKGDEMKLTARPASGATGAASGIFYSSDVNWARDPAAVATQSTTGYGGLASRAIDGSTRSDWAGNSITCTTSTAPNWWQVDLGADRLVSSVVLYNREDGDLERRLSNYRVSVLDVAGNVLVSQDFHTAGTYTGKRELWNLATPVTGRVVRVEQLGPNHRGDYYLSLAEVQVYSTVNWALDPQAVASASSVSYGGHAARINDGNPNGSWYGYSVAQTANTPSSWLQVDLGTDREISSVVIFPRTDHNYERMMSNFRVSILNGSGQVVASKDYHTQSGYVHQKEHWNLETPVTGRKVRVEGLGANRFGHYYLAVAELKVLGSTELPLASDGDYIRMKFGNPGTYLFTGNHPTAVNGSFSVTVREVRFSQDPIHKFSNLVSDIRFNDNLVDPRLWYDGGTAMPVDSALNPKGNDGYSYLKVSSSGSGTGNLLARLHENGPVVGVQPVNLFVVTDALQNDNTTATLSEDFPGYYIMTTPLVVSDFPPGGTVVVTIFRAGVRFKNGSTQMSITEAMMVDGVFNLEFLYPMNMVGGYCHYLDIYDGSGNYMGRR